MKTIQLSNVWKVDSEFAEKELVKAAGARWHPGKWSCGRAGCKACANGIDRSWWTDDPLVAVKLNGGAEVLQAQVVAKEAQKQETIEQSRAASADIDVPAPEGLAYMPFQLAGIRYAMNRTNVLIGDEMGLGKSIETIGLINADPSIKTVLVICPATLRENWRREAIKWLVRPLSVAVAKDSVPDTDVVIINYERVRPEKIKGATKKDDKLVQAGLLADLLKRHWDLLVLDEAHRCKTYDALQTRGILGWWDKKERKEVAGLFQSSTRHLALTGTPIPNRPIELHPLLSKLAPKEFGNWHRFVTRYCNGYEGRWGWDVSGASHLDELQETMRSSVMIRRLKKDVLTELPAKTRQIVTIEANGYSQVVERESNAWTQHEDELARLQDNVDLAHASGDETAYQSVVAVLRDAAQAAFAEISKLRHETALAKVDAVIEHCDTLIESITQLVIFAHHKDVIAKLAAHWGTDCVTLTGDTPMGDRQGLVDRFQNHDVKVFIGSITAAGVGLTLTAANTVVFAELDWVPGNVSQAEDRLHRIGQHDNVLVQHLVIDGSLDARMAKTLVEKQEIADRALDRLPVKTEPAIPLARAPRPRKYPEATEGQREAALACLRALTAVDGDYARKQNNMGFNSGDSHVGHELAEKVTLTDGQVWLAKRILMKYHRQLGELLEPLKAEETTK